MPENLNVTRPEIKESGDSLVFYADFGADGDTVSAGETPENKTSLIWYDTKSLKGEVYNISFEGDAVSIEKGEITPAAAGSGGAPDFSGFEKISLETFDRLAEEINETISGADSVENA